MFYTNKQNLTNTPRVTDLTFLALHPAVSVLAVLAVVAPVPGQAVAVLLYGLAPVTVETSHPALDDETF